MKNVVGVIFDNDEKTYYLDANGLELKVNLTVIAEIEKGTFLGKVSTKPLETDKDVDGKIIRVANKKDYTSYKNNQKDAGQAIKKCRELIKKYELNMNILDATFTISKDQLIFHFYSEERIDFRNLARDLASIYKTRIELRQIGVRDKSKKIGGCGSCGQQLCCSRFLNDFNSVSISMAKNQNLSLNPNKINGVCGRLLCCLKYENDVYTEMKKDLPKVGEKVEIPQGSGKVISVDLFKKCYVVELSDKTRVEVVLDDKSKK